MHFFFLCDQNAGKYPCTFTYTHFSSKLAVYICCILFLSARSECRDGSRHPRLFILFRTAEKEAQYSKGIYPYDPFFLINLPFTYAIHFFFLCSQNAGTALDTLCYSFFFVPPKKNESRKRRPPETPIPLRMSVIAKWAKLASLKQNAHF